MLRNTVEWLQVTSRKNKNRISSLWNVFSNFIKGTICWVFVRSGQQWKSICVIMYQK